MTAIAVYEKRHREELSDTDQWFRGDYIGVRMLKNGCRLTLAFLIGFAFYVVLHVLLVQGLCNLLTLAIRN